MRPTMPAAIANRDPPTRARLVVDMTLTLALTRCFSALNEILAGWGAPSGVGVSWTTRHELEVWRCCDWNLVARSLPLCGCQIHGRVPLNGSPRVDERPEMSLEASGLGWAQSIRDRLTDGA